VLPARIIVVVAWLIVLVSVVGIERAEGSACANSFSLPGTESAKALSLLQSALPKQSGDSDQIVWHVKSGSVTDPAVRGRIEALLAKVAGCPSVVGVRSPYSPAGAAQVSRDGKTAYATVLFDQLAQSLGSVTTRVCSRAAPLRRRQWSAPWASAAPSRFVLAPRPQVTIAWKPSSTAALRSHAHTRKAMPVARAP
jgi:hypothetical protein